MGDFYICTHVLPVPTSSPKVNQTSFPKFYPQSNYVSTTSCIPSQVFQSLCTTQSDSHRSLSMYGKRLSSCHASLGQHENSQLTGNIPSQLWNVLPVTGLPSKNANLTLNKLDVFRPCSLVSWMMTNLISGCLKRAVERTEPEPFDSCVTHG